MQSVCAIKEDRMQSDACNHVGGLGGHSTHLPLFPGSPGSPEEIRPELQSTTPRVTKQAWPAKYSKYSDLSGGNSGVA